MSWEGNVPLWGHSAISVEDRGRPRILTFGDVRSWGALGLTVSLSRRLWEQEEVHTLPLTVGGSGLAEGEGRGSSAAGGFPVPQVQAGGLRRLGGPTLTPNNRWPRATGCPTAALESALLSPLL